MILWRFLTIWFALGFCGYLIERRWRRIHRRPHKHWIDLVGSLLLNLELGPIGILAAWITYG